MAKAARRFENLDQAKKKRRRLNRQRNSNSFRADPDIDLAETDDETTEHANLVQMLGIEGAALIPPPLERESESQKHEQDDEAINDPSTYLDSLRALKSGMDEHELELLKKKTVEVDRITRQKVVAMTDAIKQICLHQPSMIGCIPGLDDQVTLAFDLWIAHMKPAILLDPAIAKDTMGFARRLMTLKRNADTWRTFVEQWRLTRILFDDDFGLVFSAIKESLRIAPAPAPAPTNDNAAPSQNAVPEESEEKEL